MSISWAFDSKLNVYSTMNNFGRNQWGQWLDRVHSGLLWHWEGHILISEVITPMYEWAKNH